MSAILAEISPLDRNVLSLAQAVHLWFDYWALLELSFKIKFLQTFSATNKDQLT